MKSTLSSLLYFYLPLVTNSIDFNTNACPEITLYRTPTSRNSKCFVNPDVLSDVPRMVKRNGYKLVTHSVTTDDGYILTLFEIFGSVSKKFTIFIQHGIATNSVPWVDVGKRSLAFYLADQGYRVFLGNIRGTTYSKKHKRLTVDDPNYWIFNLDTLVEKDLMTQIGFIVHKTGQKTHYIGHSMGSTLGLMFMSRFSDRANQWIQSAALLAPVVYLHNIPLVDGVKNPSLAILDYLSVNGINGLFYQEAHIQKVITNSCKVFPEICLAIINISFGTTSNFLNEDLLLYYSSWPTGMSVFQLKQYLQIAISKTFQRFDYGSRENLEKYGTMLPPLYNLTSVDLPVCLFYGENDNLYSKEGVERTYNEITSNKKCKHSISGDNGNYNHIDFMFGKSIIKDLYHLLSDVLNRYEYK